MSRQPSPRTLVVTLSPDPWEAADRISYALGGRAAAVEWLRKVLEALENGARTW